MASNESVRKAILSTIDEMSEESGMARIEDFYDRLKEEHNIDRVTAGKMVIQLYKEGKLHSPLYHHMKTC
ncbi:MAG: hypothetical protein ACE5Z5_10935 [Candidatus Bathyarchaeia archaeon]